MIFSSSAHKYPHLLHSIFTALTLARSGMDDDDASVFGPGQEEDEQSWLEGQRKTLQIYLDSIPYKCESYEVMQEKLEFIVGRLYIAAKAKNWQLVSSWDGLLQCWLLMRYPIVKSTRAKLVRFYYELCILPGIDTRTMKSWSDMISRLCNNKPGQKRKLESSDLELSWKPLWRIMQRVLWAESGKQTASLYLEVAFQCKHFFPAREIPEMLETFLPLLTFNTVLTMTAVITSFLPQTHADSYLPAIFKIWEGFNSAFIDERFMELAGDLSRDHVSGPEGQYGNDGTAQWKDVGIWSNEQWNLLASKGLNMMTVPVGASKTSASTAPHADTGLDKPPKAVRSLNKTNALAKVFVYSISVDGEVRVPTPSLQDGKLPTSTGFLAGSKVLDTLDKLITCTESFFHPSNSGPWTAMLTLFVHHLSSHFLRRMKEEELKTCKTPQDRRLTPALRRAFVSILRTPCLLAMFSKDSMSLGFAQASLRMLALLEPDLIMPELLDRAYNGLEVVNETHRTTAVLGMLASITQPLTTEGIWLGGQKHIVPLLELCVPGIDLNDPAKTVCATLFITGVAQSIKIGDLSMHHAGVALSGDIPPEEVMDVDDSERLPEGTEMGSTPKLSRQEERSLARDSTAAFADWVTSLFRRVLALYENLPEEGGKKGTTGGKVEESVLKSIRNMMDVICLHLSDQLFDLVLNLVYDYATTNAKPNAVRAFGQLIACLARVKPEKTLARFLPFCKAQIEEELYHGASSIRTTSTHTAVASDTTLHWNMAILRGCFGYGDAGLLKHKDDIISLISLLVEKTKSERGYTGTGRLLARILHTIAGVYPLNGHYVNEEEWNDPNFQNNHNLYWGKLYEAKDVVIDWHVPSEQEIAFVIEIINKITAPALDKVEGLLETTSTWDSAARNDFCRYLHVVRLTWSGLPTIYKEHYQESANPCLNAEIESLGLVVRYLDVQAGFTLVDPRDLRYQFVVRARRRFGEICQRASSTLRKNTGGEDHTDAVITVARGMDTYLLGYGLSRSDFDSIHKNYTQARDGGRAWQWQKELSRLVLLKRARAYHSGRVYMHSLYRRRSELDDRLLAELAELSLSPYTRIRRQAQNVFDNVSGYYIRSTRFVLPILYDALGKGNDPDRMKGALYIMWNKGIATYALTDQGLQRRYLQSLLGCQGEEKPSVQKLVSSVANDCMGLINENTIHSEAYTLETPRLDETLRDLENEFSENFVDKELLDEALHKGKLRFERRNRVHHETVTDIIEIATKPTTHWRYVQMSLGFLFNLLRRDHPVMPQMAQFFVDHCISPQPTIRATAQKALRKLLYQIKCRTYSKTKEELWFEEWRNPIAQEVKITDPEAFLNGLQLTGQVSENDFYFDKVPTGFLVWSKTIKGCKPVVGNLPPFVWELESQPTLDILEASLLQPDFFKKIISLWSQETGRGAGNLDVRTENIWLMKYMSKMLVQYDLNGVLDAIEPLLWDTDKYKQRAGAEIWAGFMRGSKHWPQNKKSHLWNWTVERFKNVFNNIKPETVTFWESLILWVLDGRDPRRNQPLTDWILSLPFEFSGDSAFEMKKCVTLVNILATSAGVFFNSIADKYVKIIFDNANTGFAELRNAFCHTIRTITQNQWRPWHPSVQAFLVACSSENDPLLIRKARYMGRIEDILHEMPKWREERLPPPRVSQSEYDKIGLTLLEWLWICAHGPQVSVIFPYAVPMLPEILRMSELNDSSDLHTYSTAVLYIISAVSPPVEYVDAILSHFVAAIKSTTSWRTRLQALPTLVVFFYRNLLFISQDGISSVMELLMDCLSDENVEVREMASKTLAGVVRCSQRQSIIPLKNRFVSKIKRTSLPPRRDAGYADALRALHSVVLGLCALVESMPYSVEPWMPPLTEVLAAHATDPPPISTTIRKCASEFKKTHQDTWHKDQLLFDEDQLQNLSSMLVGTSYYA
ncbi:hypothetical protein Agabi119p4_880 [Agaricus bisporus var. burnettii]|uniref:ARM repeat-containing protein n=1 Tax=Agaricus bisporus var. burnettii TaxID=192524 RepID=A0A8H7FBQ7_AGABI|nr:hypothetical protein Agabi119p4_880 [Agaricus bisporus var. burnettii]